MKVLAIESSAVTASVAIMTEDTLIAEYTINYKKTHSQTLLPMIDEICRMTETDVSDIDIVAVSDGPGSFTGLRIGAATGKGIALAKDKPMVAVPTLEAMAYNLMGDKRLICPVMDARRQHLYSGLYRFDAEKLEIIHEQCLISYQELVDILNAQDEEVVFVGDGIDVAGDYIDSISSGELIGLKSKIEDMGRLADELGIGTITLEDIVKELEKPGRDPRDEKLMADLLTENSCLR